MVMDTDSIPGDLVTRHVVGQLINAIAAGDWKSLASCIDPAIVYWRPGTKDRIDGVDAYLAQWKQYRNEGKLIYKAHTVMVQGDTAMVEASASGQLANGASFNYSLVSIMRIAGGRVVEEREYIVPAEG
jgi:ketosteroid isomerase-like protein